MLVLIEPYLKSFSKMRCVTVRQAPGEDCQLGGRGAIRHAVGIWRKPGSKRFLTLICIALAWRKALDNRRSC
jgi:hypothetical protein